MSPADEVDELQTAKDRTYLRVLAGLNWDPRLQGRLDPSDIVQEVLMQAHASRAQYQGRSENQWRAWLRAILANKMADALRKFARQGGNVERSLEAALEESSARIEPWLAAPGASPDEEAQRGEQFVRLAEALGRLPPDQHLAVELHYLEELSVPEVARRMGRSGASVAGLLRRGLRALRDLLPEGELPTPPESADGAVGG